VKRVQGGKISFPLSLIKGNPSKKRERAFFSFPSTSKKKKVLRKKREGKEDVSFSYSEEKESSGNREPRRDRGNSTKGKRARQQLKGKGGRGES